MLEPIAVREPLSLPRLLNPQRIDTFLVGLVIEILLFAPA
jgi:hypothetical protein